MTVEADTSGLHGDGEGAVGDALTDLLAGFIGELRQAGLPVSLTENLDAMEAVRHIPLEDRQAFKGGEQTYAEYTQSVFREAQMSSGLGVGGNAPQPQPHIFGGGGGGSSGNAGGLLGR